MKYAIIINIDYENNDQMICRRFWEEFEREMKKAGFVKHKRLFVTTLDWEAACRQAQGVVAEVEKILANEDIVVFDLIKEFYCFEFNRMNDLLDLCHHAPDVSFVDTTTFRFFAVNADNP